MVARTTRDWLGIIQRILVELKSSWFKKQGGDQFDKFKTVDWVSDNNKSRLREAKLKESYDSSLVNRFYAAYEAAQSWIVVLLVGGAIGTSAAFISITSEWLSDIKQGRCSTNWYLNQKFCCWEIEDNEGECANWIPWGQFGDSEYSLAWVDFLVYVIAGTLFGTLCCYLILKIGPHAAGSGIAQIKAVLGGFILKGFFSWETLLMKIFGLVLAVASGLSLGKEGPSVHLASCIGNLISNFFSKFQGNRSKQREILSASAAAGVAVAFGSPVGGILYSLEELSTHFPMKTLWRSFFCALVATVALQSWNPFRTGKIVLYQVTYSQGWHNFEIPFFIILGALGGLYGAFTMRLNKWVENYRVHLTGNRAIYEVAVLAFLTSIISYFNRFLKVDMSESLLILFRDCSEHDYAGLCNDNQTSSTVTSLLLAAIIRMLLVCFTYGCKVPAGIFVPSMAIGACYGRAIGIMVEAFYKSNPKLWIFSDCPPEGACIAPGTYAFLGAAASLGGITKVTVTVVVVMFELTGAVDHILPTMITVISTKLVGDIFYHGGIADKAIEWKGFPFLNQHHSSLGPSPVGQMMVTDIKSIPATGWKLNELLDFLQQTDCRGFPVIKGVDNNRIEGFIEREDILRVINRATIEFSVSQSAHCFFNPHQIGAMSSSSIDFGRYVDVNPVIVHPKLPLETVESFFAKIGPRVILIEHQGKLMGLVTKKDLLKYQRQIHDKSHSSPIRKDKNRGFTELETQDFDDEEYPLTGFH